MYQGFRLSLRKISKMILESLLTTFAVFEAARAISKLRSIIKLPNLVNLA